MICKNCRHEVDDTQTICGFCGSVLKKSKGDKTPWICALYAPISILIILGMCLLSDLIQVPWPYSYLKTVFVDIFTIIVSFVVYFIFTMKQRANLSIWFFLLAPGTALLTEPLMDFVYFIFYLLRDEFGIFSYGGILGTLIMDLPFFLTTLLQAFIAYFIVAFVFKKVLKTKVDL